MFAYLQYYVVEDKNARKRMGSAPYAWKRTGQCWGRVTVFLKFEWEVETLQLAVIKPRAVTHFIPEIPRQNLEYCPMILARDNTRVLQILDVDFITAIAGRITLSGRSSRTEVIFETSMDSQRSDMSFTAL
jgi:hypothetical protein